MSDGAAQSLLKVVADSLMPGDQRVSAPHLAALLARLAQSGVEQAYERGR